MFELAMNFVSILFLKLSYFLVQFSFVLHFRQVKGSWLEFPIESRSLVLMDYISPSLKKFGVISFLVHIILFQF